MSEKTNNAYWLGKQILKAGITMGKPVDHDGPHMGTKEQTVLRITWRSEAMKASAHNLFHHECYSSYPYPNMSKEHIQREDVARDAECCGCRGLLREKPV